MSARSNTCRWAVISLLLVITCSRAFAGKTLYVDDDGPADFNNIQAGIDASVDGDTVLVAPGTYTGEGNRDIDFKGKAITVKSEEGPQACIIDCQGSENEQHRGFYFHNGEDANSVVQGFTIINGYATRGGGIFCEKASPHILDCLITENTAVENGGGIECDYASPTIKHCIIRNNTAYRGGGVRIGKVASDGRGLSLLVEMTNCLITGNTGCGIVVSSGTTILNCTIFGNRGDRGGGIRFGVVPRRINNLIIYGNIGSEIAIGPAGVGGCRPGSIRITHSVVGSDPNAIAARSCYSGEWLHADPLFANPGYWDANGTPNDTNDDFWIEGDYHLKSQAGRWDPNSQSWVQDEVTSPCIDAGDPNSPTGHEPFPNGGIINIGAYGGTAEASKSYFGRPACETIIAGDINGDCKVDFDDLMILMAHWLADENR